MPPTRSGFPNFCPDLDFFDQTGLDFVRKFGKSPDFQKIAKITHEIGFFRYLLNESDNVCFLEIHIFISMNYPKPGAATENP